jgi:inner membrane protein
MRSAKYAIMTIALTFLVFFLVEILNGRKIHPFQYILVGLSLCLFYILLISISEHADFNFAYLISAGSVVTMIALYSLSVFKKTKLTLLLSVILVCIYGFLFITLQLADYALLMGSIGLAIILAITMYFTRNINWYKLNISSD